MPGKPVPPLPLSAAAGLALLLPALAGFAQDPTAPPWPSWQNRYQPQAAAREPLYRLPFDAAAMVRVDQGPDGAYSHGTAANRHAVDFALPEGTPVLAARDGVVIAATPGAPARNAEDDTVENRAHVVRILHGDGSSALYAHLKPDGANVRIGQRVEAGQRIGLSGNTGFSTAPHLHFVVQVKRGGQWESIPARLAGPLGEIRFPR